jgi:hypothetical protein
VKSRTLPFGTPVVPPEDTTTAKSPCRARLAIGAVSCPLASSSRWSGTSSTGQWPRRARW